MTERHFVGSGKPCGGGALTKGHGQTVGHHKKELDLGPVAIIRVVGVGGGGGNAINSMISAELAGVDFIAINTDAQDLSRSIAPTRIRIGDKSTRGLGAGGDASVARAAAEESKDEIRAALEGSDMVFVAAGMGGGTGSGAAPVVARIARELGALTVGVVTLPFGFEGVRRRLTADAATEAIAAEVDALLAIPNDRLRDATGHSTLLIDAFSSANDVLRSAVGGISDMITVPGLINLDFADVRAVMAGAGTALLGVGSAEGADRARAAAERALTSPLVGAGTIRGATGIIVNISSGTSLTLAEVAEAAGVVNEIADAEANVIIGTSLDPRYGEALTVTVIATGFERVAESADLTTALGQEYAYTPVSYPPEPSYAESTRIERTPFPGQRQAAPVAQPQPARPSGWLSRFTSSEITGFNPNDLEVPTFLRRRR